MSVFFEWALYGRSPIGAKARRQVFTDLPTEKVREASGDRTFGAHVTSFLGGC
jgi:hypothetical protein